MIPAHDMTFDNGVALWLYSVERTIETEVDGSLHFERVTVETRRFPGDKAANIWFRNSEYADDVACALFVVYKDGQRAPLF